MKKWVFILFAIPLCLVACNAQDFNGGSLAGTTWKGTYKVQHLDGRSKVHFTLTFSPTAASANLDFKFKDTAGDKVTGDEEMVGPYTYAYPRVTVATNDLKFGEIDARIEGNKMIARLEGQDVVLKYRP